MAQNALVRRSIAAISSASQKLAKSSGVAANLLPRSKGGETPLVLQTAHTTIHTFFTSADGLTQLLYSAENWVRIKLELKTAGPVAIGTSADIAPVLSGRGILLEENELFETYLPKGNRFYIVSESVNRVNVIIEPVPWYEQLDADIIASNSRVTAAVNAMSAAVTGAMAELATLLGGQPPAPPPPTPAPCPPPGNGLYPKPMPLPPSMFRRR